MTNVRWPHIDRLESITVLSLILTLLPSVPGLAGESAVTARQPRTFMRDLARLSDLELDRIDRGEPVAKILETSDRAEIHAFGAVHIGAPIDSFVAMFRDLELETEVEAVKIQERFGDPPRLSDVERLVLPKEDIKDLRKCEPGKCGVQLPADDMERFRAEIDWNGADPAEQVNRLARTMVVEAVEAYQEGGLAALGAYRDKKQPSVVAEQYEALLGRFPVLRDYAPELHRYLLEYPRAELAGAEDILYWDRVMFGLKPTVRLHHLVVHQVPDSELAGYAIASKQIYASHYFTAAVDMWICVADGRQPASPGFYVIRLESSRQHGMTGLQGKLVREPLVKLLREGIDKGLVAMKWALENMPGQKLKD